MTKCKKEKKSLLSLCCDNVENKGGCCHNVARYCSFPSFSSEEKNKNKEKKRSERVGRCLEVGGYLDFKSKGRVR
jgi:hypothetical protein